VNYESSAGLIISYDQLDIYEGHYWPVISPAIQTKPVQKSSVVEMHFRVRAAAKLSTKPALSGVGCSNFCLFCQKVKASTFAFLPKSGKF